MINSYVSRMILMLASITIISSSYAAVNNQTVLKARAAYDKENITALSKYTRELEAKNHMLAPYAKYWLMRLNLDEVDNQTITSFLLQYADYPFADRLRGEYLKKLGKQRDWERFSQEQIQYKSENTAVACYAAEAYKARPNTGTLMFAKPLWLSAKERPNACNRLFDSMQAEGVIDEEAIWQRFRLALGSNRVSLAKSIPKRSKHYQASQIKFISRASKSPKKTLSKKQVSLKTRFGREVNLFALIRLSKKDTWQALAAFKKIQNSFNADEQSYFYGMLGLSASKRHESEAQLWFQKADFEGLNHEQISWFARATLRQKDWAGLLAVIEKMPPLIADEARWRYWKARALIERKQNDEAIGILTGLAPERHYYGWLAQDELKGYTAPTLLHYKPTHDEVSKMSALAGIQRAEVLFDLDLRWEGRREWAKVIEGFGDKQLLAAAKFANRKQWYDLAINTADKTKEFHDFSLRYLMPYKGLMGKAANTQNIDETWVHGIVRQESRFMHYAKSRVGAAGLMQLMPTTARWAAKRAGVKKYKRSMIYDLDTNVAIGTYYLRHTLEVMKGSKVMASAGYNAGPGRAKRWRAKQSLEGAIYAETIPFNETRNYVQRVMANTHLYAQQLGRNRMKLKQRMGIVPAK